jgi:nitroreductase
MKTTDVFEAVKNRRSIRAFQEREVSEEQIETIIDAAIHAPSAGNIQPWEFVVVTDWQVKRQLAVAALNQSFIEEAPVVIVVCADEARSGQGYGSRGVGLYCIQDTAAATQNMLLAAHAMGLGTCWVGAFREDMVRKALKTPSHVRPVAIVPVGYAAEEPALRRRRSVSEVVHRDNF